MRIANQASKQNQAPVGLHSLLVDRNPTRLLYDDQKDHRFENSNSNQDQGGDIASLGGSLKTRRWHHHVPGI